MHLTLKTLLNHIEPWKGFVYDTSDLTDHGKRAILEIQLRARAGSQGLCGQCQQRAPGYDRQAPRRFQFVPLWGIPTFFIYAPRRLDCHTCGVHVEHLPWALGKRPITKSFAWFLASWAKRLSWQEASRAFKTSWESVYRSVEMAVDWGRSRMDLTGITACGVDEIHWQKGKFLTLVYQINEGVKRLLYIAEERKESSLREFFVWFGQDRSALIEFICSDMWQPYLNVIQRYAPNALNILDRYHIAAKMNQAIDKIRAAETRVIAQGKKGIQTVLTHSRWCLLKPPENLTDLQAINLKDLLASNLKTIRAYLLKQEFQFFWEYHSPAWAEKFLRQWCTKAMR